ncbi:hypothetical protein OUZ56_015910 [Daphnia magna]|uniref:G-protein coupled receptors family 1 profile domain-containing protein n=1 Tax=Daphnia magna TaxID=35525 RepID=A0ABR0AP38_9CRUS|nr:hypothetical protein OUZ56_015910 [Daphnia magna]
MEVVDLLRKKWTVSKDDDSAQCALAKIECLRSHLLVLIITTFVICCPLDVLSFLRVARRGRGSDICYLFSVISSYRQHLAFNAFSGLINSSATNKMRSYPATIQIPVK